MNGAYLQLKVTDAVSIILLGRSKFIHERYSKEENEAFHKGKPHTDLLYLYNTAFRRELFCRHRTREEKSLRFYDLGSLKITLRYPPPFKIFVLKGEQVHLFFSKKKSF